jgi:hypothetical protein
VQVAVDSSMVSNILTPNQYSVLLCIYMKKRSLLFAIFPQ